MTTHAFGRAPRLHGLFRTLVLPTMLAASILAAPGAAYAGTGVTTLCSSATYSCLAGTGYTGQSVWGSWGPGHNCVSYAAYRLSQTGPKPWTGNIGDGGDWDEKAIAAGIPVNTTPAVGSIAQWDGGDGHVAYVEAVTAAYIEVSEDNYLSDTSGYSSRRRLERSGTTFQAAEFIHVRDTPAGPVYGSQTIGSYNPATSTFYLRNTNAPGAADATVQYGNAGWIPLAGDWDGHDDGNSQMTIGAYDPASGRFYLRNSNTSGPADNAFQYGNLGWLPIAGDWDGNGFWSIGLYDPATSTFHLRNENSSGPANLTIQFGNAGWVPLAGDWDGHDDGNAATTIGLYDPGTATFYLNNENDGSAAESTVQYGNIGWTPVTGDWDSNGFTSIGNYDSATATYYLRNVNSPGPADTTVQYGNGGWKAIVGNWDGQ